MDYGWNYSRSGTGGSCSRREASGSQNLLINIPDSSSPTAATTATQMSIEDFVSQP